MTIPLADGYTHAPLHYNIHIVYDDDTPYIRHTYELNAANSPYFDSAAEQRHINADTYLTLNTEDNCKSYADAFRKIRMANGSGMDGFANVDGIRLMTWDNQTDDTTFMMDGMILEGLKW
jgi:hypothetical protein